MADHAHNLDPGRLVSDDSEPDSLAQRIFIAEYFSRQLSVNDGYRRRAFFVMLSKVASTDQWNAHCRKVTGHHRTEFSACRVVRSAFKFHRAARIAPGKWQPADYAGFDDAGNSLHSRGQSLIVVHDLRLSRVFELRCWQAHGQHAMRRETGVHPHDRD